MRTFLSPIAVALAVVLLAGCGGDGGGDENPPGPQLSADRPSKDEVSPTVRGYLTALGNGDGKRACRLLDDRGKAALIAFLPSDQESIGCRRAVRRVSRQIIPVRRFEIEEVVVTGRSATANVVANDPPYSSGVLLAADGDGWRISYPPGLQAKSGEPPPGAAPGVPLEQD
jgi:hypothetical protein